MGDNCVLVCLLFTEVYSIAVTALATVSRAWHSALYVSMRKSDCRLATDELRGFRECRQPV